MARMAQKPPMPMGTTVASAPPANITCASPILMVRQASPMAWLAVAQAEQVAKFGPRRLKYIETRPDAMLRDEHRNHERREPAGTALEQDFQLVAGGLQPADAGAEEHADFVQVFLVEFEAGIFQRAPRGIDAELRIAVRAADFLGRRKRRRRVKVFHLAGDLRGQTPSRRTP